MMGLQVILNENNKRCPIENFKKLRIFLENFHTFYVYIFNSLILVKKKKKISSKIIPRFEQFFPTFFSFSWADKWKLLILHNKVLVLHFPLIYHRFRFKFSSL